MSISRSIIVVDDELELASLFKAFLKNEGYDVVSFTDPVLALEYYKETADKHSLIITDLENAWYMWNRPCKEYKGI